MVRLVPLAVLVAVGLILASCGDDDEPAGPLTSEELVAAASAACDGAGAAAVDAEGAEAILGEGDFVEFWQTEYQPILDELEQDLEALEPPTVMAADFNALLAAIAESNDLSRDDPIVVAAAAIDPDATTAERYAALDGEIDELAVALGLPGDCGELEAGS